MQLEKVLAYLAAVTHVDRHALTTLYVAGEPMGAVNAQWLERLLEHESALFQCTPEGLSCRCDGSYEVNSRVLRQAAERWRDAGWLNGWRNENFQASQADGTPLFELERAAFRPLGLTSHAVHLNGLTRRGDGEVCMWLGRRSPDKAVDPDRMDNMVGGGVASGETIAVARERESWEEAGLPAEVSAEAEEVSTLLAERPVVRGLHREWLHVFDLWLPADIEPCNQDGEVAEHVCVSLSAVEALLVEQRFMIDAALVAAECLARLRYWGDDSWRVLACLRG